MTYRESSVFDHLPSITISSSVSVVTDGKAYLVVTHGASVAAIADSLENAIHFAKTVKA